MSKIEVEVDTDDNTPSMIRSSWNRQLEAQYTLSGHFLGSYVPPKFNTLLHRPIKRVRVANCDVHSGTKPLYLYAEILPEHVGTGEKTSYNQNLAMNIRQRGKRDDDCGHIIGAQLGGKMVEFNLFPQAKTINRGLYGLNKLWRRGVEEVMRAWLSLPRKVNPRVKFEIVLFYASTDYPDRPNKTKFVLTMERDSSDDDEDDDDEESEDILEATLKAELLNELAVETSEELAAFERINWENFTSIFGNKYLLFQKFLEQILVAIVEEEPGSGVPTPSPSPVPTPARAISSTPAPRGSNTPFSFWDLVPVVGDVRSICQGIEDAEDGNVLGATANLVMGVGGMALNLMTLGASGAVAKAVVKGGGRVAAKEGGKVLVKEAGKQAIKTSSRQIFKETVKTAIIIARWTKFVVNKQYSSIAV